MIVTASNSAGSLDNDNRTVASCFAYRSNRKIHVHSGGGVSDSWGCGTWSQISRTCSLGCVTFTRFPAWKGKKKTSTSIILYIFIHTFGVATFFRLSKSFGKYMEMLPVQKNAGVWPRWEHGMWSEETWWLGCLAGRSRVGSASPVVQQTDWCLVNYQLPPSPTHVPAFYHADLQSLYSHTKQIYFPLEKISAKAKTVRASWWRINFVWDPGVVVGTRFLLFLSRACEALRQSLWRPEIPSSRDSWWS